MSSKFAAYLGSAEPTEMIFHTVRSLFHWAG
jgi:hypothetical protein